MDKELREYMDAVKIYDKMRPILKKRYRSLLQNLAKELKAHKLLAFNIDGCWAPLSISYSYAESWLPGGGATFNWDMVARGTIRIRLRGNIPVDIDICEYPLEDLDDITQLIEDIKVATKNFDIY